MPALGFEAMVDLMFACVVTCMFLNYGVTPADPLSASIAANFCFMFLFLNIGDTVCGTVHSTQYCTLISIISSHLCICMTICITLGQIKKLHKMFDLLNCFN